VLGRDVQGHRAPDRGHTPSGVERCSGKPATVRHTHCSLRHTTRSDGAGIPGGGQCQDVACRGIGSPSGGTPQVGWNDALVCRDNAVRGGRVPNMGTQARACGTTSWRAKPRALPMQRYRRGRYPCTAQLRLGQEGRATVGVSGVEVSRPCL